MTINPKSDQTDYHRYHIQTQPAEEIEKWPPRFNVRVKRLGLAKLLGKEILHYGWRNREAITSRPCMYGVFSGPVGGFAPRPQHCVGCLRCTTEYPDFVTVSHNPARRDLGDSFFTFEQINAVSMEADNGMVPVRGAGYRGKFGGDGWDGMWTDMSEIVRPTRDGIHGREFISTSVEIGYRPNFLRFDADKKSIGRKPSVISIPLPILYDVPPKSLAGREYCTATASAAEAVESLALIPMEILLENELKGEHIVPVVKLGQETAMEMLDFQPRMVELDGWSDVVYEAVQRTFPGAILSLRLPFTEAENLTEYIEKGIHTFHLFADYHGRGEDGGFVLDLIRKVHTGFVELGIRQEVTLIGSGGMISAGHIPKAILCGLDAIALDTPVIAAFQGAFNGECIRRDDSQFSLPRNFDPKWGQQRLMNLTASWRDQLLEISGAMGLREVRRMRGEMGRAMFMFELEASAFAGVSGYENR
jgi:hypothetical protein